MMTHATVEHCLQQIPHWQQESKPADKLSVRFSINDEEHNCAESEKSLIIRPLFREQVCSGGRKIWNGSAG